MQFEDLRLIEPLLRAIRREGYTTPTAIQAQAMPPALEGKDVLGCAQTGTGKTAAFALPILQRLHEADAVSKQPNSNGNGNGRSRDGAHRATRALILAPTRELAAQIAASFAAYGRHTGLRHTVVFGGVSQRPQEQALRQGVDILVATPGRLMDLMDQGIVSLSRVEYLVLDEADRMLDMGFIADIRRIIAQLPGGPGGAAKRQTLMFSATMPPAIRQLADTILRKPVTVKVASQSAAADTVDQAVYHIDQRGKAILLEQLLGSDAMTRALVFSRTKRGADRIAQRLSKAGVRAEAIHSDKSQNARMRALKQFSDGHVRVLVASDLAARGLDVDEISHVINYDLPNTSETYVHRIGRTGRAGAAGRAISFCCDEERDMLHEIEKLIGRHIPVMMHTIKPSPVDQRVAGGHAPHGGGQPKRRFAAKAPVNATGEQKKAEFWRGKRKRRRRRSTAGA